MYMTNAKTSIQRNQKKYKDIYIWQMERHQFKDQVK